MKRQIPLILLFSVVFSVAAVALQSDDPTTSLTNANKLLKDNNPKDAAILFRAVVGANNAESADLVAALKGLEQCRARLNDYVDLDADLKLATENHANDYRVLAEAARQLSESVHYGVVADQQFTRGFDRGYAGRGGSAGTRVNVQQEDWLQAVQWCVQAIDVAKAQGLNADANAIGELHLQFATIFVGQRQGQLAWQLTTLSDLTRAPNYTNVDTPDYPPGRAAPVDEDGRPVLYKVPESWESAKNDGERYRWLLDQAAKSDTTKWQAKWAWANFLDSQFSVSTLNNYAWNFRARKPTSEETGTYAVHTLEESETIAKLANGIRRFELPDEHNPIRIYQEIAAADEAVVKAAAAFRLVNIFLDRRQYPKSAELLADYIKRFGDDSQRSKQKLLDSIRLPRMTFDRTPTQLAGSNAKLSLVFRNATSMGLVARRVDLEKILSDTKTFYRGLPNSQTTGFGNLRNRQPPQLSAPADLFSDERISKYLIGDPTSWTVAVAPRENHWDKRIEVDTPLSAAGLYVVDAVATAGESDASYTSRCLVWLQDAALIRKPIDGKSLFVMVDAASGKPIGGADVEWFGYGYDQRNKTTNGRPQVVTKNFAARTNANGEAVVELESQFQWMAAARSSDGKIALLDFEHFWQREVQRQQYERLKIYGVSDRPMYRPGDRVRGKAWAANVAYGDEQPAVLAGSSLVITIQDGQGNRVSEQQLTTDEFGGCEFEFELSGAAPLGRYSVICTTPGGMQHTALAFRVEEYRKPEFEVNILSAKKPVALGETIEARIQAKYYFGAPVVDASVSVKVERSTFSDSYYPVFPFDWCYGPGYWWYAAEYPWYPGWEQWRGCFAPDPNHFPRRWGREPAELVLEQELQLDASGEAIISIDTALAKALYGDENQEYSISVEVRDASRRTITASGKVIAAREAFEVYSWLNKGYYQVGEKIEASFHARMLDGTPVKASGTVDLLKIQYDANANPSERVVASFKVETDDEGKLNQAIQANQAGQYRVRARLSDNQDRMVDGAYIVTVRGDGVTGDDFRYAALELIPDKAHYTPGETVKLQITADRSDARVFLFVRPESGIYPRPTIVTLQNKSAIVQIVVSEKDQPNFFVEAFTVYDGELHSVKREIFVPPAERVLDVELTADKDEYLPGEQAEVILTVRDPEGKPVVGSCVVAAYDRSLEQIAGDVLPKDIREFFWKWQRQHHIDIRSSLNKYCFPVSIKNNDPFNYLGVFGSSLADDLDAMEGKERRLAANEDEGLGQPFGGLAGGMGGMGGGMFGDRMEMKSLDAVAEGAPMAAQAKSRSDSGPTGAAAPAENPTVRKDFADSALWMANVSTDASGKAKVEFKMPENLTSWKLATWVVGQGTRVGSASTQAVTRKPLLIRLQTPRFLVERDEVVISAIVHNDLPSNQSVKVTLEIDGETQFELLPDSKAEQTVNINSFEQARIDWRCRAIAEGTVTLRAIAIANGGSDAMQLELPIVVNGILKTDSFAGTVRTGQSSSKVTLSIPDARRVAQSKLTVRLSPSLAASMIDALPYLAHYPYGCTEQTLNRFLPTVITQRTLQEMQIDLSSLAERRRNNLNAQELGDAATRREQWRHFDDAAVFDKELVDEMVASGVMRLTDMQLNDGGWGWFSGGLERSSPHTTATVVRGLLIAQQNGVAIVPDVLGRGLGWLEQYQNVELQKLQNAGSKTQPYKSAPNSLDALVFHTLVLAERNNPAMQQILFDDRDKLGVYGMSLLAWATHKLDNSEQTAMLRRNIEQFLVEDAENETAFLDDDSPWWYWYGSQIEGTAMYLKLLAAQDPNGRVAPRLVKYLLNNRKHSTYWNSTRDTALVVEAFGDFLKATGETTARMTAEVWLKGKRLGQIQFTPENLFTTNNTIEIAGNAVPAGTAELEIRRMGEGNLYWNAFSTNFTLEEEIAPAGLEVKIERRYYSLQSETEDLTLPDANASAVTVEREHVKRIALDDLQNVPSGELVEVELLVQSKNDYEYLVIEDRKPAGLETVETQSGYFYNAGLLIYRELRDKHIGLCIRNLPKGNYSIRYQLRSETPGTFTALPATIEGMYAPELVGNSADFDFQVTEEASPTND